MRTQTAWKGCLLIAMFSGLVFFMLDARKGIDSADTTGGKIAAAIKAQGSTDTPSFAADSLSGERQIDRESEVAAFANRDNPAT